MIESLGMASLTLAIQKGWRGRRYRRRGCGGMLGELAAGAEGEESSSLYLAPGDSPDASALAMSGWAQPVSDLGDSALRDGCGLVGLRTGGRGLLIAPPFPVPETFLAMDWDDEPLRRILDADFTVGVALV